MITTFLELAGLVLLVAAAYVAAGLALALLAGSAACLFASWSMTRSRR
jgi:hypothetical protein